MIDSLLLPRWLVWWRVLLILALVLVTYASLAPSSGGALFVGVDKLGHCLAYACLYFLASLAFPGAVCNAPIHLALLGFGVLIEGLQAQTAYRTMEAADVLANMAGAGLGNLILLFWVKLKPQHFDQGFNKGVVGEKR